MLTLTSAEILELFDVKSPGTLTKWRSLGAGQAVIGRNRWNARAFLEWWLSTIYDGTTCETDGSLAEARCDYWTAKAERERMAANREKGELAPWPVIHEEWQKRAVAVISGLEHLKDRLPPVLAGRNRDAVYEILRHEVKALRRLYLAGGRYTPTFELAEEHNAKTKIEPDRTSNG